MVHTYRRVVALAVLVVFWPAMVLGQTQRAGVVTTLEGNVTAARVALPQPVPLKFKDEVFLRDKIVTGDRSLARLLLGAKAIVTVRERSSLTVTEVPGRSTVELESGKLGLAVARERMRPGEVIDIRTPNAIVAVRGTVAVVEVTRATAQVGGAPPVVTSNVYLLRGTAEATRVNPATGTPIGAPFPLSVLTSLRVTGIAAPVIAPIPPEQVAQITAGLHASSPQHGDAANKDQVKSQILAATSAVLTALTAGGAESPLLVAPPVATAAAEGESVATPPGTAAPITSLTFSQVLDTPEIAIAGNLFIDPGLTLKTFDGTLSRAGISPLIKVSNPPLPLTIGEFQVALDTLTDPEVLALAATGNTLVAQLGADNLIEVKPGAAVTLATRLVETQNATILAGNNFLRVEGTLTSTGPGGLMFFDPSALFSESDFVFVGPGGVLNLVGPAIDAVQSLVGAGGNLVHVGAGGRIDAAARLLNLVTSIADTDGNLLRIVNGGVVSGGGAQGLIGAAGSLIETLGGVIVLGAAAGAPPPMLSLTGGGLFNAADSVIVNGNPLANVNTFLFVADGAQVTGLGPVPLLTLDRTTIDSAGALVAVRRSRSAAQPTMVSLAGPLLVASDSLINTTSLGFSGTFGGAGAACCAGFNVEQGAQLKSTTPAALIQLVRTVFNGGPDGQSGGNFFQAFDSGPTTTEIVLPPRVALAGPLLDAQASTILSLFNTVNVGRATLTSITGAALLAAAGSRIVAGGVDPFSGAMTSGRLFNQFASSTSGAVSGAPSLVALAGPLAALAGTTLVTAADVAGVFNGAVFTSTTPAALIQLAGSNVTAGASSAVFGRMLSIGNLGGVTGNEFATMVLNGGVLSSVDGAMALNAGLIGVFPGGQLVVNGGGDAVALISGGSHDLGTLQGFPMFSLTGRGTALAADPDEPSLMVGTDQPIVTSRVLLDAVGTTIRGQKVARFVDQTLLNSTVEALFRARGGASLTIEQDAIDLANQSRVVTAAPVLALNASSFTVNNGSVVVVNNSHLKVTGDLLSLSNGSTLRTLNGPVLKVAGGSVVNVTGAFAAFGGTAGNQIAFTNNLCAGSCTSAGGITIAGIPIALTNGAGGTQVTINASGTILRNSQLGSLVPSGAGAAAIQVDGTGARVTISGQ